MLEGPWLPGSFTKNFSWGKGEGLRQLYESINVGFDHQLAPVPREEYRRRVEGQNRSSLIPINFFLCNQVIDGENCLIVDELVFQALTGEHSQRFDKLALFAFNFSMAGRWNGMREGQRYPALWAKGYVIDRVAGDFAWDTSKISAADIERYLRDSGKFLAQTFTKASTNLNYLYNIGGLDGFASARIERWWVDCLFLALDRITADPRPRVIAIPPSSLPSLLVQSKFAELSGPKSSEKTFAMAHLLSLYNVCGGRKRFEPESVKDRIAIALPDYVGALANDDRPQGALHPTNPRILKTIPRDCAELAKAIGFQIVLADDLEAFDPDEFVRERAKAAVTNLGAQGIHPLISSEELHKITRGE